MMKAVVYEERKHIKEQLERFKEDVEKIGIGVEEAYEYCVKRALKEGVPATGLQQLEASLSRRFYKDIVLPFSEFESVYKLHLCIQKDLRYKGYGKWTDPKLSYTHVYITNRPTAKLVCSTGQSWTTCWRPTQSKIYPLVYESDVYIAYLLRGHKVKGRVFIAKMESTFVMFNLAGSEIHDLLLEEILKSFAMKMYKDAPEIRKFRWISSNTEDAEADHYGDLKYVWDINSLYIAFYEYISVRSPSSFSTGARYYRCPSCGKASLIIDESTAWCEHDDCEFNRYVEKEGDE